MSDLRITMVRAGFKYGLTTVAVGGSLFTLGASETVKMSILRVLSFLGSPESALSVFHRLLGGTIMSQNILTGTGAVTLAAGTFMTLVSFPTSVGASDLDSMYRQPEFQSQLLVSKAYSQLVSHFGYTSERILNDYYQGQDLKTLIKTFANNEKDRQVLIDFYSWWR